MHSIVYFMIYVGVFSFGLLTIEVTQDCHLNIISNFTATENFKNKSFIILKNLTKETSFSTLNSKNFTKLLW